MEDIAKNVYEELKHDKKNKYHNRKNKRWAN